MYKLNRVTKLSLGLVACAATASMLATAAPAAAAKAKPQPPAQTGYTMVNGEGQKITLPSAALAGFKSSGSGAGNSLGQPVLQDKPTGPSVSSVIGADSRVQESSPGAYPWRSIVHLQMSLGGCSGFMLSRDVVVTAAHCVYNFEAKAWATSYKATPGKNGASEPFGSCSGGIADVWALQAYMDTKSPDWDFGLIKLRCDIGNTTGWLNWWYYNNTADYVNKHVFVEGYPGDKTFGTMWWDGDFVTTATNRRLNYNVDTAPGQSGSPIYMQLNGGWTIIGIHTHGVTSTNTKNSGVRFNADVMNFIQHWINQP